MTIQHPYKPRPIRFLGIHSHTDDKNGTWQIKLYRISVRSGFQPDDMRELLECVKQHLPAWLANSRNYPLQTYSIATLILHEGKEGYFAIINWWIDDNMLQNHVYLATFDKPDEFTHYGNPQYLMYESLVRAVSIRYNMQSKEFRGMVEKNFAQQDKAGFFWMREVVGLLGEYEGNRKQYPSFDTFLPRFRALFERIARKAAK